MQKKSTIETLGVNIMKGYNSNDMEYAATRLDGTLVRHEGDVVEVRSVRGRDHRAKIKDPVSVRNVEGGDSYTVSMAKLDITPPPLGFVNYEGRAHYVVRVPLRRDWRQGLRYSNIRSMSGTDSGNIPYSVLAQTIRGRFPSIRTVMSRLQDIHHSRAWSRCWAISRDGELLYKSQGVVGTITEGRPVLSGKYSYLQETLDEDYVPQ